MFIKKGTVIKSYKKNSIPVILIKTIGSDACENCSSKKSCISSSNENNKKEFEITVTNSLNANIGDEVLIKINNVPFFKMLFSVYLFPILMMVLGLVIGHIINLFFKINIDIDLFFILISFSFFLFSFYFLKKIYKYIFTKSYYKPKLFKIIKNFDCYNKIF